MTININLNQIVMMLGAVLSLMVFFVGWPRRKVIGGFYFVVFSLSVTWWLITGIVESFVIDQSVKILWSQILYIGFTLTYPSLFLFIVSYIRQSKISLSIVLSLMVIPVITLIIAWTNSYHGWLWSGYSQGSIENNVLIYQHGFWFWLHTVYLYLLMLMGLFYLIGNILKSQQPFRSQLLIILAGVLFPIFTGTMYILNISFVHGMDITPTGLVFTSMFLVWGLLRFQFLELLPVARATLIDQLKDGVIVLDPKGRIVDINPSTQKLFGWNPKEIFGQDIALVSPMFAELVHNTEEQKEWKITLPDSSTIILNVQISILSNENHQEIGKLLVLRDITENKRMEQEIRRLSLIDELTGLYNRRGFTLLAEQEMKFVHRYKRNMVLIFADVDDMKLINDNFGHTQGDLALMEVATILKETFREMDILARFGGDEFLIMASDESIENSDILINRLSTTLEEHNRKCNRPYQLTLSMGIVRYDSDTPFILGEMITQADYQMYLQKQAKKEKI